MQDENRTIEEKRIYKVVKSNQLIQNLRNKTGHLSLQEQRLILYLISQVKPSDTEFARFDLSCQEFCKICGITCTGKNYDYIKQTIQKLADRSFWIETGEKGESQNLVRWISDAEVTQRGHVSIQIHPKLQPFLLHLKEFYTSYLLEYILPMKSRYSVLLYELLRSYANIETYTFDVEELKMFLGAEKYERWADFQRKVLDIAMREINDLSDLEVDYQIIKESRRFAKLRFRIRILEPIELKDRDILRKQILDN